MTLEQRSEKAKGERHTAQTASERQATSQLKSIGERGAESRGEKRGTEVQRYGCYRYSTLLPYSFPAEFIQLEDGFLQYQLMEQIIQNMLGILHWLWMEKPAIIKWS